MYFHKSTLSCKASTMSPFLQLGNPGSNVPPSSQCQASLNAGDRSEALPGPPGSWHSGMGPRFSGVCLAHDSLPPHSTCGYITTECSRTLTDHRTAPIWPTELGVLETQPQEKKVACPRSLDGSDAGLVSGSGLLVLKNQWLPNSS